MEDDLPSWFLRLDAPFLSPPITQLLNASLLQSFVPHQWKAALICSIGGSKRGLHDCITLSDSDIASYTNVIAKKTKCRTKTKLQSSDNSSPHANKTSTIRPLPTYQDMNDVQLCVFCAEMTMPGDNLKCDSCSEFFHFECCQIPVDRHADMLTLIEFLGWTSRACRFVAASNLELLKQSIADLSSELKTLRASFPGAVASNKDREAPTSVIATTSSQTTGVPIVPKDPYIPSTNNHPQSI